MDQLAPRACPHLLSPEKTSPDGCSFPPLQNDAASLELAAAEMAQAAANLVSVERELISLQTDGVCSWGAHGSRLIVISRRLRALTSYVSFAQAPCFQKMLLVVSMCQH